MKHTKSTNRSRRFSFRVAVIAAVLGLSAAAGTAQAGYFNIYGGYVPTCVPGYWAPGPIGPIWVPAVCG